MKIVISGGLGYVGGRLSKYLSSQGHTVVALSRQVGSLPAVEWPQNLKIIHPNAVFSDLSILKGVDVFIHLAALNENDCVKYPELAIDINIKQTLQWLDHTYKAGVNRFIYFSTAHVYGKPLQGFYDENSLAKPAHPYAITHKCAEDYVLAYAAEKGMKNLVIRLTNAFGGPAFPTANRWTLLVNDLCRSAVETGTMTLQSDGTQLRDFISLKDVGRAVDHLLLVSETEHRVFNMGSGRAITVWEMALLVKEKAEAVLQKHIELTRKLPHASLVPASLEISIQQLVQTGFTLAGEIENEIESTLRYFINHPQV